MKQNLFKTIIATLAIIMAVSGCAINNETVPQTSEIVSENTSKEIESKTDVSSVNSSTVIESEVISNETTSSTSSSSVSSSSTSSSEITTSRPAITIISSSSTSSSSSSASSSSKPVEPVTSSQNAPTIQVPAVDNINARTIMRYTAGTHNLQGYTLFDFSNKKESGIGRDGTENQTNPARMCYGITAEIKDNKVYFAFYNDYPDKFKISINATNLISDTKITSLQTSDGTQVLDCSKFDNGMYILQMVLSNSKKTATAFYVNNGKPYLCSACKMSNSEYNQFKARRELVQSLMDADNITPENSVATDILCYPWCDLYGDNSDTKKWIALSYQITKPEWSDSRKVFAIHEWMSENLAYDYYKVNNLRYQRAYELQVFDGTYDTYQTRIGVCFDFTNIFATMCRAQGIPCITIDNNTHCWNVVYVNNIWTEIDTSKDIKNTVYTEDMTKWNRPANPHCYKGFYNEIVNNATPLYTNDTLWTYDIATGRVKTKASQAS